MAKLGILRVLLFVHFAQHIFVITSTSKTQWVSENMPLQHTPAAESVRQLDNEALARRASSEPAAFIELYQRFLEAVYRYHLARTGQHVEAQDLTSQTFTSALEGIRTYRGQGSFAAWLFGIARNKMALYFRSQRPETGLEEALDLPDPGPQPEAMAFQRLSLEQLGLALESISPDRAEALRLCLICDLTAAETGKLLGKSEAAVKMLIFRGLRDLREKLTTPEVEAL